MRTAGGTVRAEGALRHETSRRSRADPQTAGGTGPDADGHPNGPRNTKKAPSAIGPKPIAWFQVSASPR